jgi:hypothetical protein
MVGGADSGKQSPRFARERRHNDIGDNGTKLGRTGNDVRC